MSYFPKANTPVPADSTLKSTTLPGVFLELVQRAIDSIAHAPLGTIVTMTKTQTIATIGLTIPSTAFFPAALVAVPAIRPILSYTAGSEVASADVPAGWKLKVPGRDGIAIVDTNYSAALLMAVLLMKEAERGASVTGQGITASTYNDVTRQFVAAAAIPIDATVSPSGVTQDRVIDYVGTLASYVDLLASPN